MSWILAILGRDRRLRVDEAFHGCQLHCVFGPPNSYTSAGDVSRIRSLG